MDRNQIAITIEKEDSLRDVLDNRASILQEVGGWRKGMSHFVNLGKALELAKTNYELPESRRCPVCESGVDCDGVDSCYCSGCDKSFYMTVLYDVGEEFE